MSTPRSYELSLSSYPGLSPPSSFTSIASVATGPSKDSFQCLYFAGSVRKSTVTLNMRHSSSTCIIHPQHATWHVDRGPIRLVHPVCRIRGSVLTEDDPERLRALVPDVLPAVGCAAVEVGAVARLELLGLAIVMESDLALEHVEELHLPGIDDDLVRFDALGPGLERRHDRADLALEEPGPEDVPLLRRAVERYHRVLALSGHVEPPVGPLLEERADRHSQRGGELAESRQRRRQSSRFDLGHHARRHAGLLRELALLETALRPQALDARAQGGHGVASRRSARATKTRLIFFRYGCVKSGLSSGLDGLTAASATRWISSGVSRSPTSSAAAAGAGRGWDATAPSVIAASVTTGPSMRSATATPKIGKSKAPRRLSLR